MYIKLKKLFNLALKIIVKLFIKYFVKYIQGKLLHLNANFRLFFMCFQFRVIHLWDLSKFIFHSTIVIMSFHVNFHWLFKALNDTKMWNEEIFNNSRKISVNFLTTPPKKISRLPTEDQNRYDKNNLYSTKNTNLFLWRNTLMDSPTTKFHRMGERKFP